MSVLPIQKLLRHRHHSILGHLGIVAHEDGGIVPWHRGFRLRARSSFCTQRVPNANAVGARARGLGLGNDPNHH